MAGSTAARLSGPRARFSWRVLWLLWLPVIALAAGAYAEFLAALAQRESSGVASKINQYGYAGLYQMGEAALIDAGYYRGDGTRNNDWRGGWTGKNGIYSLRDFLATAPEQTRAITDYHATLWRQIERLGLDRYLGQTVRGVTMTASGLIAGAHLLGAGGLRSCLRGSGCADANGTSAFSYMAQFGGYEVSDLIGGTFDPPPSDPGTEPNPIVGDGTVWRAASPAEAFYAGAGVDMAEVREAVAEAAVLAAVLWAAWVAQAQFFSWRRGRIALMNMQTTLVTATVLTLIVLFFTLA
jgi:hypothetical protein